MTYGLEQNILQSPISLFLSFTLILGTINFGSIVQKYFIKKLKIKNFKVNIFLSPIIGTYSFLYPLYLIFLILELQASLFIKLVSIFFICFGNIANF